MALLADVLEYLGDPHLVRRFQHVFGVREHVISREDENSSTYLQVTQRYSITRPFWYYLFVFGTFLGDGPFYLTLFSFWTWNLDALVIRKVVLVWSIMLFIGQGIKDIVCWPRPASPPVFRLQKKWVLEHGMPSTHAMVGIAIPFSVLIYTMHRYQYPVVYGMLFAISWCTVISLSRIYLGMHSVLDVLVGLLLALVLMIPVVPLVDWLDMLLLTNRWTPLMLILITAPLIAYYPTTTRWTPTRGDTTMIVSFCVGMYIGAWTNYQQGVMTEPSTPPPYAIIWPSWPMFGDAVLRTVIGLCSIVATIAVCKSAQHAIMRCIMQDSIIRESWQMEHYSTQDKIQIFCKYLSYSLLGFNILYLMPNVFKMLRIERPTFYTEM